MNRPAIEGTRSDRTRTDLMAAFTTLVFARGFENISVRDVVAAAGIARSTFYEHFDSKEDVLRACTEQFFSVVADCVTHDRPPPDLDRVLDHFWGNRRLADGIFTGRARKVLERHQADMLESRLRALAGGPLSAMPSRLAATGLASLQLGMIESWLRGHTHCDLRAIAAGLHKSSRAAARAFL